MENLLSKYIDLPIDDPTTGSFKEYDPKMIELRVGVMFGLATLMLIINLRKEFAALRYISVVILITILFTILVKKF